MHCVGGAGGKIDTVTEFQKASHSFVSHMRVPGGSKLRLLDVFLLFSLVLFVSI